MTLTQPGHQQQRHGHHTPPAQAVVVVQVLELLFRLQWSRLDGLGALVITPTRELALQIFEELRKVGKRHELSAGLLVGGKKVKQEQQAVHGEAAGRPGCLQTPAVCSGHTGW